MGNSLRCCIACVIPCGALDLIRIVHLNGYVEEYTRPITAGEVLKANPNHILSKPSSQGVVRKILILSPESELKRGSIYFLIPSASLPENKMSKISSKKCESFQEKQKTVLESENKELNKDDHVVKKHSRRDRRSGRSGVWRPHLETISEDN